MIKEKQLQLINSRNEKAKQIDQWNDEILKCKKHINDMAAEFEQKLKDTVVQKFKWLDKNSRPMGVGDDRSSEIALLRRLDDIAARRR